MNDSQVQPTNDVAVVT